MDPDRWARVKELFHAALEREPGRRPQFVRDACAGDESLRESVEAMLAREPEARSFLESPAIPARQPGPLTAGRGALSCAPTAAPPMALRAGTRLGPFEIVAALGAGGMGEVYRARDTRLERDVALKVLPAAKLAEDDARARLLREARMASRLNHPNVCTVHEVGEVEGEIYIAMELVEGEPLSARLSRGALPADEALRLGRQLADAVAHAHERGVVHRDLKSANVVITPQGRAKVLDFGLARPLPGKDQPMTANTGLTAPGAVIGTVAYMAPEQLRGSPVDERCDIWALGIVLYEMAGGRRPFVGTTGFALSSAILTQAPPPLPARVPAALAEAIGRCLEKQPQARYQGAAELRSALEAIQAPPSADTAATTRAAVSRARTPSRKRIRSLAVLPLASLSGDAEQEYFADGMTDALIATLAKLRALRVISRRSAMRYKATDRPLAEIAAELDVDAVVEGSVLRAGPRVRITVELVRPASSRCEWAESYDRDLKNVLFLQSEVAQAIAREIQLAVTPKEAKRLASAHPVNPEAYEAWLKGRFQWYGLSREKLDAAMGYFRLAVEKDPSCALAWAGMAATWGSLTDAGFAPPHEAIPKARAAALKALELDDTLAEVHVRLANLRFCIDWDWASARAAFRRAIELDPNSADARLFFADFLISLGRVKAAITEDERALKLDPFNFFLRGFVGWHLVYQRRHDEAIAELRKVVQMEPAFSSAHMGLWGAFYRKGIPAEAFAAARTFFEVLGDGETVQALEQGYAASGYSGAMSVAAQRLTARAALTHVPAVRIARLHAHAGELDLALEWLERAYASRESPLVHLAVAWDWDSLRAHSRFQRLLRLMRLPPQ